MKTAVLTVKVNDQVKTRAQSVAKAVGIPLSTLVNAYLVDLGTTGQVHFAAAEPMTPKMEKIIEQAEREIAAGETSGPFDAAESAIAYLKKL
jgi:antitoxin component of RelBE/YafQ-DinJ toxin-antitoxin module